MASLARLHPPQLAKFVRGCVLSFIARMVSVTLYYSGTSHHTENPIVSYQVPGIRY